MSPIPDSLGPLSGKKTSKQTCVYCCTVLQHLNLFHRARVRIYLPACQWPLTACGHPSNARNYVVEASSRNRSIGVDAPVCQRCSFMYGRVSSRCQPRGKRGDRCCSPFFSEAMRRPSTTFPLSPPPKKKNQRRVRCVFVGPRGGIFCNSSPRG